MLAAAPSGNAGPPSATTTPVVHSTGNHHGRRARIFVTHVEGQLRQDIDRGCGPPAESSRGYVAPQTCRTSTPTGRLPAPAPHGRVRQSSGWCYVTRLRKTAWAVARGRGRLAASGAAV